MGADRKNEIRCICSRHPLLATYGIGKDGSPFIHMKVFKQSRIYGEIFVSADAVVRIRCRECLRLQKVKIISGRPSIEEEKGMPEPTTALPASTILRMTTNME